MSSGSVGRRRTRVGKYELGRTLGEGTFAKVKFATNIENGDCVAIKIIDRDRVLRHKMIEQAILLLLPIPPLSLSLSLYFLLSQLLVHRFF